MPIPVKDLAGVQAPLPERIHRYLADHADHAFTPFEILGGVEGYDRNALAIAGIFWKPDETRRALAPVVAALLKLKRSGLVQSGTRAGTTYWAIAPAGSRR